MKYRLPCLLLMLVFSACSRHSTILYTGSCAGKKLELRHISETNFDHSQEYQELWYHNKKLATIDLHALNNGLPYREDLYGNAPRAVFDTTARYYLYGNPQRPVPTIRLMLYIDPGQCSEETFGLLTQFFREKMPELQKVIDANTPGFQPYQIAGWVYGREEDFEQRYTAAGNKNNTIVIYPDGRIDHISKDRGTVLTSSGGLAGRVDMPGARIPIEDSAQMNLDELRRYHNEKTGRSIATDFHLYYSLNPGSR